MITTSLILYNLKKIRFITSTVITKNLWQYLPGMLQVWYHSNCRNRGKGCYNTNLTDRGGCCIWYDEPALLGAIEEHLGVTIDSVEQDLKVPTNEFDGQVTYGQKRTNKGTLNQLGDLKSLTLTALDQSQSRLW